MIPSNFDYYAPTSLQDALDLLYQHGEEAKVMAGGHSLVPMMKLRLARPSLLIGIGRAPGLAGIERVNDEVRIGATTTHAHIEHAQALKHLLPIMSEAAFEIGDPLVRHRGTLGGSLAHADPAGDWPAIALTLDAQLKLVDTQGERLVAANDFFLDLFTTDLKATEILAEVRFPLREGTVGMAYQKFKNPASGYAVVGVATVLQMDEEKQCRDCRVSITGASSLVFRATRTEQMLREQPLTSTLLMQAAERAAEGHDMLADTFASSAYRTHLVKVMTQRALRIAAVRSGVEL